MKNDLKKLRDEKKITQQELANMVGVSRQTINMVENDRYDPTLKLAMKLAKKLNKPVEEIFELEEEEA